MIFRYEVRKITSEWILSTYSLQYSFRRVLSYYQLDFLTPGISPLFASSRKQIRQRSNILMNPRFRPHRKHRLTLREENFGFFCARAIVDVFGISVFDYSFLLPLQAEIRCFQKAPFPALCFLRSQRPSLPSQK